MLNQETKDTLVGLQGHRNTILLEKEETWRLKSRALWLACGDKNTKFFHAYAKGRKDLNTIWCLEDDRGRRRESFEELDETGVEHFQNLFKAPVGAHIVEIMQVAQVFPRFVGEEENNSLVEEVSEEELKVAL